jgi:hypothetical protein
MSVRSDAAGPLLAFFTLSVLALARPDLLRPYFGPAPPALAAGSVALVGLMSLRYLTRTAGFPQRLPTCATVPGLFAIAAAFGAAIIVADIALHYPRDLNAPLPWALLFYPAIGYVAEVVFHLTPLALVLAVLARGAAPSPRARWIAMALARLAEPAFQTYAAGQFDARTAYTFVHVLAFSVVQLLVFGRHGFAAMFALRLAYYAIWHIGWGAARLHLLF